MKILEVHEIKKEFFNLDYSNIDIIVFDDGLYTQYLNLNFFESLNIPLKFAISAGIVAKDKQNPEFIECYNAHNKAFKGNFENYMNWEQIKEISLKHEILGHGYSHKRFKTFNSAKRDTEKMLESFKNHKIDIQGFCFPYNDENEMLKLILKSKGIVTFYGNGRIPIEIL